MFRARKYKDLEGVLGYKFKAQELLSRALTHSSYKGSTKNSADNERLEFIGDRVLGLAIAELLHETFPKANEGELARRYNRLVRGETCARVGRQLGLGNHLILSESESASGGRDKETILADAVEAVLGAVFLDSNYDKAKTVVRRVWELLNEQHTRTASADPKSALQEWAQGKGLPLPNYIEIARTGPDHAPLFTTEVRIPGCAPIRGEGASKRAAEQAAASALLDREGVTGPGTSHDQ